MSSISDRVTIARENGANIRAALTAPPPVHEPSGVYAALADYRADILSAIRRGWAVSSLAASLIESGVDFSRQSIAKAIDHIIDDALRDAIAGGAKPGAAVKQVLGINLATANAQVTARVERRITRLTHPTSPPTKDARGNRNA
jgi:hypothetical protein